MLVRMSSKEPVAVAVGDRIAQLVAERCEFGGAKSVLSLPEKSLHAMANSASDVQPRSVKVFLNSIKPSSSTRVKKTVDESAAMLPVHSLGRTM